MSNPPASLKAIQPFLIVSKQYRERDPVVAYYCKQKTRSYANDTGAGGFRRAFCCNISRLWVLPLIVRVGQLYAVQQGIKLAKGDSSAKSYLLQMMDQLEKVPFP